MNAPISQALILPTPKTNIEFANSIEEVESFELDYNETKIWFDNFHECFYRRSRDCYGEYSPVKVYFYFDLASKLQQDGEKAFYDKCRSLGYNQLKVDIAHKFFIENEKPQAVWLWLLETKRATLEWDTVRQMKSRMRKSFLEFVKKDK